MSRFGLLLTTFKHAEPAQTAPAKVYSLSEYIADIQAKEARARDEARDSVHRLAERQHDVLYALERDGALALAENHLQDAAHRVLSDYALYSEAGA